MGGIRLTRRLFIVGVAGVVALTAVAACGNGSGDNDATGSTVASDAGGDTVDAGAVTVELPPYPMWPNDTIVEDQALLDSLAAEYATAQGDDALEMERFLFGVVPVAAFDRIFETPPDELSTKGLLWVFHLSGYFGGVWLRSEIDRAQPGSSQLSGVVIPATEEGFLAVASAAADGIAASEGSDAEALGYAEASLFPANRSGITDGLSENFGYNQGYMLQILEAPPEGFDTPEQYDVTCVDAPFACTYASPKLAALEELQPVAADLAGGSTTAYEDLAGRILPLQQQAIPNGRFVWSGGLSVEGFTQEAYDQLLDVSSSYLEDVQATGLAGSKATAEGDVDMARRAAVANSCMDVWLAAYTAGLTEGGSTDLPTFATG